MSKNHPIRIVLLVLAALFIVASLPAQTPLTESQAYKKADEYLLLHFQNKFMKTEVFKERFGEIAWEDISQDVMDSMDFVRDRKAEKDLYQEKSYAFIGDMLELEILIDRIVLDKISGELQDIEIMFW